MHLGVLILAGGRSSRMGVDKATQAWGAGRAVDRLIALSQSLGAEIVMTSGPADYGVPFVVDGVADGGPVCGLLAGGAAMARKGCSRVLALAVDAPTVLAADLSPLLAAPAPGAAYDGLHLPLVWTPAVIPAGAAGGWPVRRFIEAAGLARLPCAPGAEARLRGANTPAEREALLSSVVGASGRAQNSGAPPNFCAAT